MTLGLIFQNPVTYEVGLPWIRSKGEIVKHFNLNVLRSFKVLTETPNQTLYHYTGISAHHLCCGITEPVQDNRQSPDGFVHYMPHHPIVKQDHSTTKVCIVYDGSATSQDCNVAMNDCLQVGPNLIPNRSC